ncbi:MAG: CapA family protein [Lachnospira sp.]
MVAEKTVKKFLSMMCLFSVVSLSLWGCGKQTETVDNPEVESSTQEETVDIHPFDFTLCFAGDINLAEGEVTTKQLDQSNGDITKCISPELIKYMKDADLTLVNNEFCYSNRGTPLPNKAWTFRANTSRVSVLKDMGVDVVQLANNHVYDYGEEAILDTFSTLESAGIPYVGAGRNLSEAMKPYYTEIDGKKIAIVAASRAEKYRMTPQATENSAGILRCYDTTLYLQEIQEARANADYVIAIVHWGTEHTTVLEDVQKSTARDYIDAGADVIIGGHSHCLQGIEYYKGKPIFYSLGNFWFDEYDIDTMLVNLRFTGDDNTGSNLQVSVVPAVQSNYVTTIYSAQEDRLQLFNYLESISINASLDRNGVVTETKSGE